VLLKSGREIDAHVALYFDAADRGWPKQTADALTSLGLREWRRFGVGRADGLPVRMTIANELFRRVPDGS